MKEGILTLATQFRIGDLYLFHSSTPSCPASSSLWGFYDKQINGVIYLEHSTRDLRNFKLWHPLPNHYRYYRLATRDELRDYMYNLGVWESLQAPAPSHTSAPAHTSAPIPTPCSGNTRQ